MTYTQISDILIQDSQALYARIAEWPEDKQIHYDTGKQRMLLYQNGSEEDYTLTEEGLFSINWEVVFREE
jgi:hypothetical protein